MIRNAYSLIDIHYIRQKEPKGLGHVISRAKTFVGNEPFTVMLGDDIVDSKILCLKQLIDCFDEHKTSIFGALPVHENEVSKYVIVKEIKIEEVL